MCSFEVRSKLEDCEWKCPYSLNNAPRSILGDAVSILILQNILQHTDANVTREGSYRHHFCDIFGR